VRHKIIPELMGSLPDLQDSTPSNEKRESRGNNLWWRRETMVLLEKSDR